MLSFRENKSLIINEFSEADFSGAWGIPSEALGEYLRIESAKESDNYPIHFAKLYAYVFDHVRLSFNPHTIFSVKPDLGISFDDFASQDIWGDNVFFPQRTRILKKELPVEFEKMQRLMEGSVGEAYVDFWHTLPDWDFLKELGFPGVLNYAKAKKAEFEQADGDHSEQVDFLESIIICYEALLRLLHRIYRESEGQTDEFFRTSILHLIEGAPQNTYDLMQFQILMLYFEEFGTERARSLGPVDQLYYSFFLKDGFSLEEQKELWRFFFIHFTATKRFAQQPITLGGQFPDGTDRTNDLTRLILETYDELNIYDPKIHFRYHRNLADDVLLKILDMVRHGNNSLVLLNDEVIMKGYEKLGIPREESVNYVPIGCYEPTLPGIEDAQISPCWINMTKAFELLYNDGVSVSDGTRILPANSFEMPETFEEYLDQFLKVQDFFTDEIIDIMEESSRFNTVINPAPMYSSCNRACLDRGLDIHRNALKYNNITLKFFGLATVSDSLAMIRKYVYDQKLLTLDQYYQILRDNWAGHEEFRKKVKLDPDKYGNNRDYVDEIMEKVTQHIADHTSKIRTRFDRRIRIGLDSINYCLNWGKRTAATPDGRENGEMLSRNLTASPNMDREGITALMQSVLKINSADFFGAAPLDYMMHPSAVEGEKGLRDYMSLVKIFFMQGGAGLQGNILRGETLKDAQAHPENYKTLQVRVCGWNEYFVRMNADKQEHFIRSYGDR